MQRLILLFSVAMFGCNGGESDLTEMNRHIQTIGAVDILGMAVLEPTDELIQRFQLPEKCGPIIVDKNHATPSDLQPATGSAIWLVTSSDVRRMANETDAIQRTPRTVTELLTAIKECTESPEEFHEDWQAFCNAAQKRSEAIKGDSALRDRLLVVSRSEFPVEFVDKYVCRVVYNSPDTKTTGTLTTHLLMTKDEFEGLAAIPAQRQ